MKQCPTCNQIFTDETINFCLTDGSVLTAKFDSEATQVINAPRVTEPPPTAFLNYPQTPTPTTAAPQTPAPTIAAPPPRQGVSPTVVYVLIALLALVIGGGLMAMLKSGAREGTPTASATPTPKPESVAAASPASSVEPVTKQPSTNTSSSPSPTPAQAQASPPMSMATPMQAPRPSGSGGSYPEASNRYLSEGDLAYKSCYELKIMRNEIFARHGYIFKTPDMVAHFSSQSWYRPSSSNVSGQLSGVERSNTQLIQRYENGKGCN